MSGILSNLDLPTILTWITTVLIPVGIAIYKGYKASGLKGALSAAVEEFQNYDKLMVETEPMTEGQEKLLESGKVSDAAWKMSDETFRGMCEALERRDVLIDKTTLRDLVTKAESENNVDYGILIANKDNTIDEGATHIYVSYGVPMYQTKSEVEHNATVNGSSIYSIRVHWYLTDLRKTLLLSEIQMSSSEAGYVDEAIKTIEENEQKQTEQYTITCGAHYWIVTRGKVTERGAAV